MHAVTIHYIFFTGLFLATGKVDEPANNETPSTTRIEGERAAMQLYEQGKNLEAAAEFERLFQGNPDQPHLLLNAAACRRDAGQLAHAVLHADEYLSQVSLDAGMRGRVEADFSEARSRLTPVHVKLLLAPGSSTEVSIIATRVVRRGSHQPPPLMRSAPLNGDVRLALDPGEWTITASGAGYHTASRRVVVVSGQPIILSLGLVPVVSPSPRVVGRRQARQRVPTGLATRLTLISAAGVATLVGSATVVSGEHRIEMADACAWYLCPQFLRDGLRRRDIGVAIGSMGLGLLAGGLTWSSPSVKLRRTIWLTQISVGGALLVTGAIALPAASVAFNIANQSMIESWSEHYARFSRMAPHALAASSVGLGLGLIVGGATSILVDRGRWRRLRPSALLGPGSAQVTISGVF